MINGTLRSVLVAITGLILFIGLLLGFAYISAMVLDELDERIYWTVLIIVVVISLIYSFTIDYKDRKEFIKKSNSYLSIGSQLFAKYEAEFEAYYSEYLSSSARKIRPVVALAAFADKRGLSMVIDWRGEENEGEIQDFITSTIGEAITWSKTVELKMRHSGGETRDGKFIIRLFKALETDLKLIKHQLLFFDVGDDSYVFMIVDSATFRNIMKSKGIDLHGAGKLRT